MDGGRGFRGWSGGFRTEFINSAAEATPGYLPGPVAKGTWNVVLGPYEVCEQGLDYTVAVTMEFGPDGAAFAAVPAPSDHRPGPQLVPRDAHLHTVSQTGTAHRRK